MTIAMSAGEPQKGLQPVWVSWYHNTCEVSSEVEAVGCSRARPRTKEEKEP
jgi:hypothetical protein